MAKLTKVRITTKAKTAKSLGSALDDIGFKPLGRRVMVKPGVDQAPRRRATTASTTEPQV